MSKIVKCCVSHLPAGHPNACGDCDPCIMHNRANQLEALYVDWEDMYWKLAALPDLIEAAKPIAAEATYFENDADEDRRNGGYTPTDDSMMIEIPLGYLRALRSALSKGGLRDV